MGTTKLKPLEGYALIKLGGKYHHIDAPTRAYEGKSNGILIKLDEWRGEPAEFDHLIGKQVYWEELKEGTKITDNGVEYCFIALENIQGYMDE